jgi:hypothetical protein
VTVPPVSELPDVFAECPTQEELDGLASLSEKQLEELFGQLQEELEGLTDEEIAEFFGFTPEDLAILGSRTPEELTDLVLQALEACVPVEETPSFTG